MEGVLSILYETALLHGVSTQIHITGELCPRTRFSLAEILMLAGRAILPAPAVPASTKIQEHSSPVNMTLGQLLTAGLAV